MLENSKKGFTFVEIIISLFICSLILAFLIPSLIKQSVKLVEVEKTVEMKEILYEELSNSVGKDFIVERGQYTVTFSQNKASIEDKKTGKKFDYEK